MHTVKLSYLIRNWQGSPGGTYPGTYTANSLYYSHNNSKGWGTNPATVMADL